MVKFFLKNKYSLLFSSITIIVLWADQLTKYFIKTYQPEWNWKIFTIHYITNTGAGFGILKDQTIWLALISLLVAGGVIFLYNNISKEKFPQILFASFLGGVLGNLIDRLWYHYVIDFIDFKWWPAFNIADAAITVSVIGLILYYWKK